jgi:hypothetical protein
MQTNTTQIWNALQATSMSPSSAVTFTSNGLSFVKCWIWHVFFDRLHILLLLNQYYHSVPILATIGLLMRFLAYVFRLSIQDSWLALS